MITKILDKTKMLTVKELQREVELLRSFVIGHVAKDLEGDYRPKFVERILKASNDVKTEHVFKDKGSLSAYLNESKD